jgi:hypothetical protein
MSALRSIFDTIRNNTTGFGELIRQALWTSMSLGWFTLNPDQFNDLMQLVSATLAFIAIKTTVSKMRMDERMVEKDAKVEEKVEQRVAQITGTGN